MTRSDPAPPSEGALPPDRSFATLTLAVGALVASVSVCAFSAFLLLPLLHVGDALSVNTAVFSITAILVVYGGLMALTGRALQQDRLTAPLRLPSPLWFLAAFLVVLSIGQALLTWKVGAAYLFPLWHVLASLLVPLALLAYAVRRLEPVSARSLFAQFAWGGLVTICLALVLELVLGGLLVILVLALLALLLGTTRSNALLRVLLQPAPDLSRVQEILMQNPLTVVIAALAGVLLFVVVVPFLEELLKAAGPALLLRRRVRAGQPPWRSTALLWGLAAGAGYAFTENMLNGQGSLANAGSPVGLWAGAMLLRGGTSLMHMLATGTVTMGWFEALVVKDRRRALLLFTAAVAAHGLWNTGAVFLGGLSALPAASGQFAPFGSALLACVLGLLILLWFGGLIWLRGLIHWAQSAPGIQPGSGLQVVTGDIISP